MDRYVNPAGAVLWTHDMTAVVPDGFKFDRNVPDEEIEAALEPFRLFTMLSGRAFAIGRADQDPSPLRTLGFTQAVPHPESVHSVYSRRLAMPPGQDGFTDEWDWEIGPSALSPIIRKVANRQAQARREAA